MKDLVPALKKLIEQPTRKTLCYTRFSEGLTHTPEIQCVVPEGSGSHRINVGNLPGPLVLLNNCLGGDCFILNNVENSADFIDAYNKKS